MHQLIRTYQGEHSKASMFSRAPTAGVLQLHVTNDGKNCVCCLFIVCYSQHGRVGNGTSSVRTFKTRQLYNVLYGR